MSTLTTYYAKGEMPTTVRPAAEHITSAYYLKTEADMRITALVAALKQMLKVQEALMPGIRYISVPDYALLNDAPIAARAAIAAAGESK